MGKASQASRRIRLHRRRSIAASALLGSDQLWFERRPNALVRFRPERPGDFALLRLQGRDAPAYVATGLDQAAPLTWVAVVDVMRAIGVPSTDGSLRCRMRTVPIRSKRLQAQMAEVFAIAVCRDVLAQLEAKAQEQPQSA